MQKKKKYKRVIWNWLTIFSVKQTRDSHLGQKKKISTGGVFSAKYAGHDLALDIIDFPLYVETCCMLWNKNTVHLEFKTHTHTYRITKFHNYLSMYQELCIELIVRIKC